MTERNLILEFDTDHPEFRRGLEVGVIWAALTALPDQRHDFHVHGDVAEMAMRIGEQKGRAFSADIQEGGDWLIVRYEPA